MRGKNKVWKRVKRIDGVRKFVKKCNIIRENYYHCYYCYYYYCYYYYYYQSEHMVVIKYSNTLIISPAGVTLNR